MRYSVWTAKPGSGATTVALALAIQLGDAANEDVLLVDLGGDLGAALGVDDGGPGVTDWLATEGTDDTAFRRLEVQVPRSGLSLIPLGGAHEWSPRRVDELLELLGRDLRTVVVDVSTVVDRTGVPLHHLRAACAAHAHSVLVTRGCYLAMRRATALALRPSGIAFIREPGRSLAGLDVSEILGVPVLAQLDHDPKVARAVDAGLMVRRCPRVFGRQVRGLIRR